MIEPRVIRETLVTPVKHTCQVLVTGGGIAGIAAALAAARAGKKTILLERGFLLGGLATVGMVAIYLPIADGKGRQASFGIAEELLQLTKRYEVEDCFPFSWRKEGMSEEEKKKHAGICVKYNPNEYALTLEQLLLQAGVTILYGTVATAVEREGDKIRSLIVQNKGGRSAIETEFVVDATGDADVFTIAGAPTVLCPQKNPVAAWYMFSRGDQSQLRILGEADHPDESVPVAQNRFHGVTGEELTQVVQIAHQSILEEVDKEKSKGRYDLLCLPGIPQLRMTRRIAGAYTIPDAPEMKYSDSIGMVASWRKRGMIYEIPFRSLYGMEFSNLITAGRSLSAELAMWDICRVIPACAVTGQAAGIAAAIGQDARTLPVHFLQEALRTEGVKIHL